MKEAKEVEDKNLDCSIRARAIFPVLYFLYFLNFLHFLFSAENFLPCGSPVRSHSSGRL